MSIKDNIYWREITKAMFVEETKACFVVHKEDKSKAVAFWEGKEAFTTQTWRKRGSNGEPLAIMREPERFDVNYADVD